MTALSEGRRRRLDTGQALAVWAILILGSWAVLAGVAFAVYFTLRVVWP